jgi:hypothetical protein
MPNDNIVLLKLRTYVRLAAKRDDKIAMTATFMRQRKMA